MANSTSRLSGDKAADPGSYNTTVFTLRTNDGEDMDIRGLLDSYTITESLYMGSIQAEFVIQDGVNLLELLKISGNEMIGLQVQRRNPDTNDNEGFSLILYIAEVLNYSRTKPGSAVYTLRCVSEHAYINQTKTIDRGFKGTIGQVVDRIVSSDLDFTKLDHLGSGSHKNISTSSQDNIRGIFPKLRPLAAIKWLTENAFDEHSTPFYFFQTATGRIHFQSYGDLLNKDPYNTDGNAYMHEPFSTVTLGDKGYYESERRKIRKVSSELNLSKYISLSEGAFGSTIHHIDIASKTYATTSFKYNDDMKRLNKNKPFHTAPSAQYGNRSISDCTTGKNYFISLNSMAFPSHKNFHAPAETSLLKAQAYLANEDIIAHTIELSGDFKLESGNVIHVNFLKTSTEEELEFDGTTNMRDKLLSGKCLITSIVHIFKDSYTMRLQIKNDSFTTDLEDGFKASERTNT